MNKGKGFPQWTGKNVAGWKKSWFAARTQEIQSEHGGRNKERGKEMPFDQVQARPGLALNRNRGMVMREPGKLGPG